MKKTLFSFFLLMSALCVSAQVKIVDMTDSSTVHAASVFISGNRCVGVSGADGLLPLPKGYKGKVTVNHMSVPRNIRACHLSLRDLSAKEG